MLHVRCNEDIQFSRWPSGTRTVLQQKDIPFGGINKPTPTLPILRHYGGNKIATQMNLVGIYHKPKAVEQTVGLDWKL